MAPFRAASTAPVAPPGCVTPSNRLTTTASAGNDWIGWSLMSIFTRVSLGRIRHRQRGAFDPGRAVGPYFLLPDGHRGLQGIDAVAAGLEGLGPVRGGYGHHYAHLTDGQAAHPVD